MTVWQTLRSWFTSEAQSARELADDLEADWSADLDRKEAELTATPEERIGQLQGQISENESSFDEIKAKIESTDAGFEAESDAQFEAESDAEFEAESDG